MVKSGKQFKFYFSFSGRRLKYEKITKNYSYCKGKASFGSGSAL
jgi:hypothetical protein